VDPRNDVVPFSDIRVREAMQMAIDLPTIANTYYSGTAQPYPCSITSNYMVGWGFPYDQWPQDLKDQYAYNPTAAKKLLADAGYPNGFKTDIVANSQSDMDLLQVVKSYFSQVGIDMDIRPMKPPLIHLLSQLTNRTRCPRVYQGYLVLTVQPTVQLSRFRFDQYRKLHKMLKTLLMILSIMSCRPLQVSMRQSK